MAKKRLFRGVSLVLVLALFMQLLPGSVFAAEDVLTAAAADSRFGEREGEEPSASEEKEGSAVAEEIVSGRGEFQKEFLLENGQHLLAIYPRAVHYAEDGEWKEIDNTLSAVQTSRGDTVYTNAAGLWEVSLPQSLGAGPGVSVSYEGYTLEFSFAGRGTGFSENTSASAVITQPFSGAAAGQIGMESGASVEAADISAGVIQSAGTAYAADERMSQTVPQTADAAIEYASVCEGVDLRYDLISNTLKESLIIESCPEEEEVYIYRMSGEDLELSLEDDGSVLACASDSGEAVFRMPAPYVQDSAGAVSFDVEVTLEESAEGWILAYATPWDWMAADERVYPVALDPVVHPEITIANTQDQSVFQNKTEPHTWGIIECGRYSGYGISRFYVQYENIPELTSADYITGATMSLYKLQNSTVAAQVNVHKVEGTWDDTTLNWSNKPDYDPAVDDYQVIYSAGWYSWDVTDIVRSWYADGNTGMMFKAADAVENGSSDNWKQFCSSNYGGEVMPVLYMSYINNCGLESCWDYTTQSAGRAGTGYVNSYTGNLVWVADGLGFSGLRMPVSVSHVYNANDRKNNEFGMGFGWRTNYNQRVYRWESDSSYYIWEDEDGTRHYFKYKSENRYEEETGSGLLLITGRTGDYPYRISDKKGNKSYFDALGRVGVIRNNQETYCNIIVSYVSSSESSSDKYCIAGIRDGAGRFYRFTYTNGLLSRVTFHRNTTDTAVISALDYTFTNSDFTGITYPDGKSVSYSYTSAASHLLKRATDVDGFNVRYAYTSGDPYRVRSVSVYDGSSCGGTLGIVYGQNQTVFTDHNGNAEIMQFNDWGNTVSVQDGQGRAQFSEYDNNEEDDTGKVNQLNLSSKLQNTVGNLVRNSGFEKSGCWTAATGAADTGSWSYTTEESWLGSRSLKIVRTANNTFYAVRTPVSSAFTLQPGVTYTFSAYIKTVNMDSSGYGVRLGVKLVGYTGYAKTSSFVKASPEWTRIEVTYTHPSTSEAELATIHLASYSVGTVYFDCIQVEASAGASRYNLVDNGDFTFAGSTEADSYGWSEGDGCRDTEIRTTDASGSAAPQLDSSVYSMTGDAERLKRCYQDIAVSGAAGDVYTLAGWAKGDSVPLTEGTNRRFGLLARFYNTDGTESEVLLDFNTAVKSGVGWQYAAKRVVAPKAYTFIRILIVYEANANTAYFDGIQLFREEFGHSYVYDSSGNVTSVTDLRKRTTTYEYTGNDLTKMVLPTGAAQTYTYDSYHNVLTATSPEGVVSTFTYDTYGNNTSVTVGSGSDSVTVSATYSGGNRLSTITDALGNTTTYSYDPYTCVLQYVRRPGETGATQTNYTYDSVYRTTETSQASASCTYEYTDDLLTKLTGGSGTEYGFTYGAFGQIES
ncbi:MAG: DNRLRE domain-containing protein, partial [Clostridiales bacterium]|nr:DNRLRE domain-containing protein [Clostridiales bacterium]